jgi:hypothetical protein
MCRRRLPARSWRISPRRDEMASRLGKGAASHPHARRRGPGADLNGRRIVVLGTRELGQSVRMLEARRQGYLLRLYRNPHAVVATYGFRSARNVCSRLQFVQTNTSLCFPKVRSAGLISLSRSSPPHMQRNEGGGSTSGRMRFPSHFGAREMRGTSLTSTRSTAQGALGPKGNVHRVGMVVFAVGLRACRVRLIPRTVSNYPRYTQHYQSQTPTERARHLTLAMVGRGRSTP